VVNQNYFFARKGVPNGAFWVDVAIVFVLAVNVISNTHVSFLWTLLLGVGVLRGGIVFNVRTRTTQNSCKTTQLAPSCWQENKPTITVVLPVYSETDTILGIITMLFDLIGEYIQEVLIIISPKSPPLTFDFCHRAVQRFPGKVVLSIQQQNPGLGRAIRQGFKMAKGTHILTIDSDGELDPRDSKSMVKRVVDTGSDLVVASRWIAGGGVVGYSSFKQVFTRLFSSAFRIIFRTPIHDLSLGYKLVINDRRFKELKFSANFHDIATETTLRPIKKGFTVSEVPTTWVKRTTGASKNTWANNFLYIKMALRILVGF